MNILIAGIGNIFLGDDGFGVEVARQLLSRKLPPSVTVADFGIRGFDLAYAMMDDKYDVTILVDAIPQGGKPGALHTLELDLTELDQMEDWSPVDTHGMTPLRVIRLIHAMGGECNKVFIVGCEPETLGGDEGQLGLSATVSASVEEAISIIQSLVDQILSGAGGSPATIGEIFELKN